MEFLPMESARGDPRLPGGKSMERPACGEIKVALQSSRSSQVISNDSRARELLQTALVHSGKMPDGFVPENNHQEFPGPPS
jgi:hypothetical protein